MTLDPSGLDRSRPNRRPSRGVARGPVLVAAALLTSAGVCVLAAGQAGRSAPDAAAQQIDNARQAYGKWVDLQDAISRESIAWREDRGVMEGRILALEQRLAGVSDDDANIDQVISESQAALRENESTLLGLQAAEIVAADRIAELERRTLAVLDRVPAPLAEQLDRLTVEIRNASEGRAADGSSEASDSDAGSPDREDDARVYPLNVRYQNVLAALNGINRFHREITVQLERRELPGGDSVEASTMYIGLSQGYYATADGRFAGVGVAGPEGWTWSAANESAEAIRRAIDMYEGTEPPAFVPLPVRTGGGS